MAGELRDPRDPQQTHQVEPPYVQPTPEQWERLMAMDAVLALVQRNSAAIVMGWVVDNGQGPDGLYGLIDKYGRDRVIRWTRIAANLSGQEV